MIVVVVVSVTFSPAEGIWLADGKLDGAMEGGTDIYCICEIEDGTEAITSAPKVCLRLAVNVLIEEPVLAVLLFKASTID